MPHQTSFFTKSFSQTIAIIKHMATPEGTTIAELAKMLSLTRRSVFRLIQTIEQELNIPVIISRKGFGSKATYHIPPDFIESFLKPTVLPEKLTITQAVLLYLLSKEDIPPKEKDKYLHLSQHYRFLATY